MADDLQKSTIFTDPISVREAADMLGVSATRVQQFKKQGLLTSDANGKLSYSQVKGLAIERKGNVAIDAPMNSDEAYERKQIAEAQTSEFKAEMAKIELAKISGELVRTDDVIADATKTANDVCFFLNTIPVRLASKLAHKDERQITFILQDEIEAVKKAIKLGKFAIEDKAKQEDNE